MHFYFTKFIKVLSLGISMFCIGYTVNAQCTPAMPSALNITNDSVTVQWPVAGAGNYEYVVQLASAAAPATGNPTANTSVRVGGLVNNTPHTAWLRTDCGSGVFTAWQKVSFTTVCGSIATILIDSVTDISAKIEWSPIGSGATYEYVIDQASADPATGGLPLQVSKFSAGGLTQGTLYYIHLRTSCGGSDFSTWKSASFFTKYATGIAAVRNEDGLFSVYPNPANDIVYVKNINMQSAAILQAVLTDITGKLLVTVNATGNLSIDMSKYAPGMYMLRVNDGETSQTIKLQKL